MALSSTQQLTRWGGLLLVLLAFFWLMGAVLTPYLMGMALAYFLDPVADRLEERGFSRLLSVTMIMLVIVVLLALFIVLLAPIIVTQLGNLMGEIPALVEFLRSKFTEVFPGLDLGVSSLLGRFQEAAQTVGSYVANTLINSTKTIFGAVATLVIVPVVTFYILLDWDRLVAWVDAWLPRDHRSAIREIMSGIDQTLAGFIRGQGTVCLIMATYYSLALWATGLNYGIVIGIIAGLLAFIPFIGAFIGIALVVGFGLFQFWGAPGEAFNAAGLAIVLIAYFIGQSVEGNYITPKLVGKSVGLHPVMIMFALSAFGSLLGFTGMLIGVPVTASIGVVGRFILDRYRTSKLYLGEEFGQRLEDEAELAEAQERLE